MSSAAKQPIDLHVIGERLHFNDTRERTGGGRSEGVVTLAAGKKGPGAHIHTRQIEGFEVLNGSMVVVVNGKERPLAEGESAIVQAGEAHTFRNGSDTAPLVARFWYEPALHIEWMLQTMGEWAMARGGDWKNVPLLPAAFMLFTLRKEYRLSGMPFWLQDVLFGLLAGVAVITGQARKARLPAGGSA